MARTKASPSSRARAPGPTGAWMLANARSFKRDPPSFVFRMHLEHGWVVRLPLGPSKSLLHHLITHPDDVRRVLVEESARYGRDSHSYEALKEALGEGLLTTHGPGWLKQRRISQQAFHRPLLAGFAGTMSASAAAMLERWDARARDGVAELNVMDELLVLTLRILGLTMFATDLSEDGSEIGHALKEGLEHIMGRVATPFHIPHAIPTPANRRFVAALASLDRIVAAMVRERRGRTTAPADLLSALVAARDEETGDAIEDRLIRDHLMTFLLAGHETTAMALSWTFYLLSRHPDVRRRLEREVDEVIGNRLPKAEDVATLPYCRAVIDESMRLYPPVWSFERSVEVDDEIRGVEIPKGTLVMVSPYVTHRSPHLWENAEAFDPERFFPGAEGAAERPRFTYFPFGGGPHQCIGMHFALLEAVLVVATVCRTHRVDVAPGVAPDTEALITLRPRGGIAMVARRRPG